jgi:hypothetical protein
LPPAVQRQLKHVEANEITAKHKEHHHGAVAERCEQIQSRYDCGRMHQRCIVDQKGSADVVNQDENCGHPAGRVETDRVRRPYGGATQMQFRPSVTRASEQNRRAVSIALETLHRVPPCEGAASPATRQLSTTSRGTHESRAASAGIADQLGFILGQRARSVAQRVQTRPALRIRLRTMCGK